MSSKFTELIESINIFNKIERSSGYMWLTGAILSFIVFIYGLVLLIKGVMYGNGAGTYKIAGLKLTAPAMGFILIFIGLIVLFITITQTIHNSKEEFKRKYNNLGTAYVYTSPAIIGMVVLVFFPLVFGVWVAFTNYRIDIPLAKANFPTLSRFLDVFTSKNSDFRDIFFTNIWWTVINIVLAVSLGVMLALILNREDMKLKKVYRTLLVLPWAVPNYVTALMWKAMFQKEFGAVNQILSPIYAMLHMDNLQWLSKSFISLKFLDHIPYLGSLLIDAIGLKGYLVSLPFIAVVIVNVWLGFPFMMIVALGGLQSISKTFYEAAEIDGATKFQMFKFITVPLLKPTMIPAIILSIIWTFNQFNVIYLITTNDKMSLLVVSAYREAFEKGRYSYAAAYSVIIFIILAAYSIFTMKVSKATEEVY
ncbi:carbohydrate ABC transporter permease [Haliovirga abyssi]|uniref:ABC transporter permease n=1 Tax=Haliovirga abyssi TaxID=2996794 RepID=A0AAU9DZL6_9FUSO|nr:sugar ABC transporter permease [Haliovirga abyssi]BDU49440.1 ABC transporter permease [Haliovirga abyssi]